jgi:hypothetical protein
MFSFTYGYLIAPEPFLEKTILLQLNGFCSRVKYHLYQLVLFTCICFWGLFSGLSTYVSVPLLLVIIIL